MRYLANASLFYYTQEKNTFDKEYLIITLKLTCCFICKSKYLFYNIFIALMTLTGPHSSQILYQVEIDSTVPLYTDIAYIIPKMYEKNTLLSIRAMPSCQDRFKTAPEIRQMAICTEFFFPFISKSVNNQCYNPYLFGKIFQSCTTWCKKNRKNSEIYSRQFQFKSINFQTKIVCYEFPNTSVFFTPCCIVQLLNIFP